MQSGKIAPTRLGECRIRSPLPLSHQVGDGIGNFVFEDTWVRYQIEEGPASVADGPLFEKAGARENLYFEPKRTRAAIVTCGGLCPGLNNVIRSVVLELHHNYGATEVLGCRYGYRGLNPANGHDPLELDTDAVASIDKRGGTILGTSRGAEDPGVVVDFLERNAIDILFCIGGDGTIRGAHKIYEEVARRDLAIAVIGIPKTIDNDIAYCSRSFGHFTSLEEARNVLVYAHNEALSALNGIGLVKVMGRDAGFIAAGATLACGEVNFTLVPEVPFSLEGPHGFLQALHKRLLSRGHAVIAVAEGAGQGLFEATRSDQDASGNVRYNDIGPYLKHCISEYLEAREIPFDLKYIDPSYTIRSVPANSGDSMLCDQFARRAVHAAMAGRTDVMIGYANDSFFHVPMALAVEGCKRIDPESELWISVLASTGQPRAFSAGR